MANTQPAATILIVDDEIVNRKLLELMLRFDGYNTITAASGEVALALIAEKAPDLMLLDIMMPGINGYQVARVLKANPSTANIPIIMVTSLIERSAAMASLDSGAEECLTKPVDRAELWLRVRNLLRLKALGDFHQNHSLILEQQVLARTVDLQLQAQFLEHQVKERTADLQHQAHHDALTGLPNRVLFLQDLKKSLLLAAESTWTVAVLLIDLDEFKTINDTLGHAVGDQLLRQFSTRLAECVFIRDTVGRLGGDEFGVILILPHGQQGAVRVADKIRAALRLPFDLDGNEVVVTASIGITIYPDDASDAEILIKDADTAMYRAKGAGRDTFRFYTAQMNSDVLAQRELMAALRKALDRGEFVLHFQPKVQLDSGCIVGLEALLRWQRPGHGLVEPSLFIPVLEASTLIAPVGSWVIAAACRQIGEWIGSGIGPVQVSVNVSGRQFVEGDLVADISKALADNKLAGMLLELELTESTVMVNTERTVAILEKVKKLGVEVSIDDFGTGYSSLAYLRHFPIDKIKIDKAFVREITTNIGDAAIALTIIRMAHALNLQVIAEGVETVEQLTYLRRHHCDQMQGFYFSVPLSTPEVEQMLRADRRLALPEDEVAVALDTPLPIDVEAGLVKLQQLLQQKGYHVLSARSPAERMELLELCEKSSAGPNSEAFLEQVENLSAETKQMVLSGHANLASLLNAINHGSIYRFATR